MSYIINPKDENTKVCDVCGRRLLEGKAKRKNGIDLCPKHYTQILQYGRVLDNNPRTTRDPNEYHILGEITVMDLYNHKSEVVARTIFDTEDLDRVKDIKWTLNSAGYVYNPRFIYRGVKGVLMHSLIMETKDPIDHKNHDTLNNRKSNLRIVTPTQNMMNRECIGISKVAKTGKYYACIGFNGKNINLGSFYVTEDEAYFARWYAEKILYKEFRYPREEPTIDEQRKSEIINYVNNKLTKYDISIE